MVRDDEDARGPRVKRTFSAANATVADDLRHRWEKALLSYSGRPTFFDHHLSSKTFALPDRAKLTGKKAQRLYDAVLDHSAKTFFETRGLVNWCEQASTLYPLETVGDGNCLLHALSLGMIGIHDRSLTLRTALHRTLVGNSGLVFRQRWQRAQAEKNKLQGFDLEDDQWEAEWDILVGRAKEGGNSLEDIHILALAHILLRPIIVYAPVLLEGPEGENVAPVEMGGVYLPLECDPQHCYRDPLVVGYWNGHFVPFVTEASPSRSQDSDVLPVVRKDGVELEVQFRTDDDDDAWACMTKFLAVVPIDVHGGVVLGATRRRVPAEAAGQTVAQALLRELQEEEGAGQLQQQQRGRRSSGGQVGVADKMLEGKGEGGEEGRAEVWRQREEERRREEEERYGWKVKGRETTDDILGRLRLDDRQPQDKEREREREKERERVGSPGVAGGRALGSPYGGVDLARVDLARMSVAELQQHSQAVLDQKHPYSPSPPYAVGGNWGEQGQQRRVGRGGEKEDAGRVAEREREDVLAEQMRGARDALWGILPAPTRHQHASEAPYYNQPPRPSPPPQDVSARRRTPPSSSSSPPPSEQLPPTVYAVPAPPSYHAPDPPQARNVRNSPPLAAYPEDAYRGEQARAARAGEEGGRRPPGGPPSLLDKQREQEAERARRERERRRALAAAQPPSLHDKERAWKAERDSAAPLPARAPASGGAQAGAATGAGGSGHASGGGGGWDVGPGADAAHHAGPDVDAQTGRMRVLSKRGYMARDRREHGRVPGF